MEVTVKWGDRLSSNHHTSPDELAPVVRAGMGASSRVAGCLAGRRTGWGMHHLRSRGSVGGGRLTRKSRTLWQGAGPVPGIERREQQSWEEPGTSGAAEVDSRYDGTP